MALNTRLTQNIDLQADGTALTKALGTIETSLNNIVGKAGSLSKALEGGANAGSKAWNNQLKQLNILIGQAQNLQKVLDASTNKRAGGILSALDEQALGKKGAAASRLAQDLTATSTAADVLEKRLAGLNKRFAELTLAGRTVGQRDLAKQFNTQNALKDVQALEREFQKLNGQSSVTSGTKAQQENMARLRTEIAAANAELGKMGQNYRRTDFGPQITQLRTLTDQYRSAVAEARKFELAQPGRAQNAQRAAVSILNQSDASRLADIKRASSAYQFPTGISQTVSQQSAENQLADSLNKRLRLLNMIQQAQDRGAPTRSVERLNDAYKKLGGQLGENFKRLTQVNAELEKAGKNSFLGQFEAGLGRVGIIAGASFAVAGVYAFINAVKQAAQFVVEYEAALKQLQAISGSTDEQMGRLSQSIGEVGRNSTYSLLEITKAATVIAQAGYSAQETGEVLKSAITLSTASGSDPTQSVEVLTSALGAFQLQAGESGRVVDTLVTALNKSKLGMNQMGSAIQYAGATANEAGVRFEELTTIAASLANAGIKSGSTIGTGIRQLIVDMQTPSEKFLKELKDVGLTMADVDIKAKGFAGVVKTLADAGFTAEAAYASFETRAAAAFLAFKGQIGTYDQLALSIAQGGAAAEAQAHAMDSLGAQWNRLKNDLSVVAAGIGGPIVSALKVVTSLLADFVEGITDIFGPIASLIGQLGIFGKGVEIVGASLIGFSVAGPIGAAIAGLTVLASIIGSTSAQMEDLRTKTTDSEAKLTSQTQTVGSLDDAINGLIDRQSTLKGNSVALQTETVTLAERFGDLYTYLGKASSSYDDLLTAMLRYRGEALKQQGLDAQTLKTNSQIELTASQKKLNETAGVLGANSFTSSIPKELARVSNGATGTVKNQNLSNIAQAALSSNDIATVTTARNQVALYNSNNNDALKLTLKKLDERLTLIKQISSLESQVNLATQAIDTANAATTSTALHRNGSVIKITDSVNKILSAAEGGDFSGVKPTIDALRAAIATGNSDLKKLKEGTGAYAVLQNDISKTESQLARLVRAQREEDEKNAKIHPVTARKGLSLNGTQVKSELTKAFPGINVYGETTRSLATQQALYAKYKAGTGPLAAKPGTSDHANNGADKNAIDITPMAGHDIDEVVAYIEGLGLEVKQPLVERDPSTGRTHWHIAWKAKTSNALKKQQSGIEELRKAAAAQAVSSSSASIQAIIAKGKAGTDTAGNLSAQLETALGTYTSTSLASYDAQHPSKGLSGEALKLQQAGRSELVAKLKDDADKFRADLSRSIGDIAQKTFESAAKTIDLQLQQSEYDADAPVRKVDSAITQSTSKLNKDHVGAGTSYYLQQQKEVAQLNSDRAKISAQDNANGQTAVNLDAWKTKIDAMPDGETKTTQLNSYTEALNKLNDALRQTDALQQSVNDRTKTFTSDIPLKERLDNAAAAWADNNGVMKDWSTVMEDNVGPALDAVSSGLATAFEQIMTGSAGIKSALKGLISAIGQFVVQMIAKALALMAIKWFLKLIGVELVDGPGGVTLGKAQGKLNGGEIKPKKLLGGGSTGYISEGVFNKDTVPILGARGEYMLNKRAVDSLGISNVDAMNRHGANALGKMAGAVPVPANSHQEMSVYVIKPDEKPQLGPKDVILAITDDMLQGGTTKQLVRKISQGAM